MESDDVELVFWNLEICCDGASDKLVGDSMEAVFAEFVVLSDILVDGVGGAGFWHGGVEG